MHYLQNEKSIDSLGKYINSLCKNMSNEFINISNKVQKIQLKIYSSNEKYKVIENKSNKKMFKKFMKEN